VFLPTPFISGQSKLPFIYKYYELIHAKLMDLFDLQDGSKRPNPSVEKTIDTLVDREVADIRKMRRSGDFVLKNLCRFEAWTVDDESAVKRKDFS